MDKVQLESIKDNHVNIALKEYNLQFHTNYKIVSKLQTNGQFSSVYEVRNGNGEIQIMKAVDSAITEIGISNEEVIRYTKNEILNMQACNDCPYTMDIYDGAEYAVGNNQREHLFLIFMPKMVSATNYFRQNGYRLNEILKMAKDICRALDFCHKKNILHRDVKADNIFYNAAKDCFVLGDFGISRSMYNQHLAVTTIGSLIAPEILRFKDLQGRMNSDIYSLGMTVLLLNGEMSPNREVIVRKNNALNNDIRRVIFRAIDADPATRYQTANEFLHAIESTEKKLSEAQPFSGKQRCVAEFFAGNYQRALDIAEQGHKAHSKVMSFLYAYLLTCSGKADSAKQILKPYINHNATAMGLYGIIGKMDSSITPSQEREMIQYIDRSAANGFCVAQYFIGRWIIDGQCGYQKDTQKGLQYIFASVQGGFKPAMYYLRKALQRKSNEIVSAQSLHELLDIELSDYSKDDFPASMILTLSNESENT